MLLSANFLIKSWDDEIPVHQETDKTTTSDSVQIAEGRGLN
jgi:hypothetical protein